MEGISWLISVVLTAFLFLKLLKKKKETEILDRIPGPPKLPVVGNLFDIAVRRDSKWKTGKIFQKSFQWIFHLKF